MADVLQEHLEYLSLPGRSALYRRAIGEVVQEGDTVADLGCGLGVLGLFCLEAGASQVWGVDRSDAIHLARETVIKTGLKDRYHCVAGDTFQTELPEPVDLIICDHIGFFGFDYGIIEMLADARGRFLKPGGVVMPRGMDLFAAAVSSEQCRALADAWTDPKIPSQYNWLDEYHRNTRHPHGFAPEELSSAAAKLGHVALDQDGPEMFSFTAGLTIERAGLFDGIAGWFDCALGGGVRMTNSPLAEDSIKRPQAFLPVLEPFAVEPGDPVGISLKFRHDVSMIAWSVQPPGDAPQQKLSTWKSKVLAPDDLLEASARPVALTETGEARAFVLAQIDGRRSVEEIAQMVLKQRPELFPTERAIRDFVQSVLTQDCQR